MEENNLTDRSRSSNCKIDPMNKKIWLSVIKEELGLLDKLATGMAEDEQLSRPEIELAVSRSGMVTKVFEMLLNQIPAQAPPEFRREETPASKVIIKETEVLAPEAKVFVVQDITVESPLLPSPPVSPTYSPPVLPSPGPDVPTPVIEPLEIEPPKTPFLQPVKEEPVDLGLEVKKEESTKYKPTPIRTLREGLNLNDRYLFQRELFGNDKSRLDEAIAALDQLSNIQEAVGYLKANFKWVRSEASERFVQLVKRRFSE